MLLSEHLKVPIKENQSDGSSSAMYALNVLLTGVCKGKGLQRSRRRVQGSRE